MSTKEKLKKKLFDGKRLSFEELKTLLSQCDFELQRIRGDHNIYKRPDTNRIINVNQIKVEKQRNINLLK